MANKDGASQDSKDKEVKSIAGSDLDPDELAKAIEASAAAEIKSAKSAKSIKPEKLAKTGKAGKKPAKAAAADKPDEDKDTGVPIIVKRRSGYVQPPQPDSRPSKPASQSDTQPLEPPSRTQKTVAPAAADALPQPDSQSDSQPGPASRDQPDVKSAAEAQPATAEADTPSEPGAPPPVKAKPAPATAPGPPQEDSLGDPTEPQKPTVFDTIEYHLPIKARNRHYVNNAVAWVVLLLVLCAVAGYVLYQLDVIEFKDLDFTG